MSLMLTPVCDAVCCVCSFTGANVASTQTSQKQVLLTFFCIFFAHMHGYILIRFCDILHRFFRGFLISELHLLSH